MSRPGPKVLIDMGYPVDWFGSEVLADHRAADHAAGSRGLRGATPPRIWLGAKMVVYSSAVRPDNPEILEARRRKLPVIPRAANSWPSLMRQKFGIAVRRQPR